MSLNTNSSSSRNNAVQWLRAALAVVLIAFLFSRAPRSEIAASFRYALSSPRLVCAALLLVGLSLLTGALRWHILLRSQGIPLSLADTVRAFFCGQFFNAFFPGGCGGDLVRIYLVIRAAPDRKTRAAGTVLLDRLLGIYFYLAAACILVAGFRVLTLPRVPPLLVTIGSWSLLVVSLLAALAVFFYPARIQQLLQLVQTDSPGRWLRLVQSAARSASLYLQQPASLLAALALSLLNFSLLALSCVAFSRALNLAASPLQITSAFTAATLIGALPITPGALGVREGSYVLLLQQAGVSSAGGLSLGLLMYAAGVLWGLPGAAAFVQQSAPSPRRLLDEARRTLSGADSASAA